MPVILHVEDERAIRLLYKEVFEEHGYKIVQACTGEEALQWIAPPSWSVWFLVIVLFITVGADEWQ